MGLVSVLPTLIIWCLFCRLIDPLTPVNVYMFPGHSGSSLPLVIIPFLFTWDPSLQSITFPSGILGSTLPSSHFSQEVVLSSSGFPTSWPYSVRGNTRTLPCLFYPRGTSGRRLHGPSHLYPVIRYSKASLTLSSSTPPLLSYLMVDS